MRVRIGACWALVSLALVACKHDPASPPQGDGGGSEGQKVASPPSAMPSDDEADGEPRDEARGGGDDKATSAPKRVCDPGRGRCGATPEVCAADGQRWEPKPACAADQACVVGACAPLGGSLQADQVRPLAPDGWIRAWGKLDPAPAKLDGAPEKWKSGKWSKLCASAPLVLPIPAVERRKGDARALLATSLVVGQEQELWLKVGAIGLLSVWLDGQEVLEGDRSDTALDPFTDEWVAKVRVSPGVHTLAVGLTQGSDAPGAVRLRLHDLQHRPPVGVGVAPFGQAPSCDASEQLGAQVELVAAPGGFKTSVKLDLGHQSPSGAEPTIPWKVEVVGPNGQTVPGAQGELVPDAGEVGARFAAKLPQAGEYKVVVSAGEAKASFPFTYRGDLHERAVKLKQRLDADKLPAALPAGSRDSLAWAIEELMRLLESSDPDAAWLQKRLTEAEELAADLFEGRDAYAERAGIVWRAYRSELDGALQPYVVHVPQGYDRTTDPLPVVVVFHGLGNEPVEALRAVVGKPRSGGMSRTDARRKLPDFPETGAILVAPWGYGDSGQRPLGEWDVLRVLDEVSKNYKIDDRRVSMTGYSLGGTVAFFAPLHFPDRFSAAAPLCGYPNLLDYREVKRAKKRQPWEDILLQQRYIRNYTENGFATPMWVIHGDKDAPERSEVVVERAEALNYPVRFDVQPETGHNVWDYGYNPDTGLLRWLTGARKPAVPARVVLRTGDLRYARAHWVEVLGLEDGGRFAEVNAEWKKSSGQVVVEVRNASALKLDVEALGAAQVKVGGKTLGVPQGAAQVWLSKQGGDWTLSDKALDLSGRKRPGLSGPLDLALLKPTIFVYGTQDPTQTETLRQVAQDLARVSPRTAALYPVKADRDLTAQERKTHTLILLGNPRSNKLVAETQDTFGVTFEADALEFKGRRYEGPTVGISMIRPSPFAQDQYLVLHAGVDAVGTLAVRNLPELVPDWIVYDQGMTAQRGDTLLDKRSVLGGGFFGADWR